MSNLVEHVLVTLHEGRLASGRRHRPIVYAIEDDSLMVLVLRVAPRREVFER